MLETAALIISGICCLVGPSIFILACFNQPILRRSGKGPHESRATHSFAALMVLAVPLTLYGKYLPRLLGFAWVIAFLGSIFYTCTFESGARRRRMGERGEGDAPRS